MNLLRRLWRRLFPRRCCTTCEWSRDKGFTTLDCVHPLGDGYAHVVWKDGWCKHWKKRT